MINNQNQTIAETERLSSPLTSSSFRYNESSYLCTHNSFANSQDARWFFANQSRSIWENCTLRNWGASQFGKKTKKRKNNSRVIIANYGGTIRMLSIAEKIMAVRKYG